MPAELEDVLALHGFAHQGDALRLEEGGALEVGDGEAAGRADAVDERAGPLPERSAHQLFHLLARSPLSTRLPACNRPADSGHAAQLSSAPEAQFQVLISLRSTIGASMPRSNRRVHRLSSITGFPVTEVLQRLRSAGIAAANEHDLIPKAQQDTALRVLGINLATGRPPRARALKSQRAIAASNEKQNEVAEVEENAKLNDLKKNRHRVTKELRREIVGRVAEVMAYLTVNDVEGIHWRLVREFEKSRDPIDPPGVRSNDLLESALFRVHTAIAGERKYPTIAMAGAAYLHAIIANHAFHNGNKRTALVSMLVFLDLNGNVLEIEEDALFDYLVQIASHGLEVSTNNQSLADAEMILIAKWVSAHSRHLVKEERSLKFHQLREILNTYGCSFERPKKGNRINIQRGTSKVQVAYRNEGSDVELNTIRKVRKELGLSEEDGYDSTIFYNAASRIPGFIRKYRRTLQRLAKA